jgi:M-phase inducer tyrosine phosphatase
MSLLKRFADSRPAHRRHRKYLKVDLDDDMGFFSHPSSSAQFLSAPIPARKLSSASARPRDDVDEFLSSDLELSFASTVSLNSPSRSDYEPMDISPVPFCKVVTRPKNDDMVSKPSMRPRAFTSAATRGFGNDVSNDISANPLMPQTKPDTIQTKRIQRSALPSEWLAFSRPKEDSRDDENDVPTAMVSPPSHFGLSRVRHDF